MQTSHVWVADSGAEEWDYHSEILAMWQRILFSVWVCRRQVGSPRFQPWPEDALHNVAQKLLGILGMNHSRHCRHQPLVTLVVTRRFCRIPPGPSFPVCQYVQVLDQQESNASIPPASNLPPARILRFLMKLQALGPADDPNRLAIVDFFPYSNLALWCSECRWILAFGLVVSSHFSIFSNDYECHAVLSRLSSVMKGFKKHGQSLYRKITVYDS